MSRLSAVISARNDSANDLIQDHGFLSHPIHYKDKQNREDQNGNQFSEKQPNSPT